MYITNLKFFISDTPSAEIIFALQLMASTTAGNVQQIAKQRSMEALDKLRTYTGPDSR